jgi:hypothetical protein
MADRILDLGLESPATPSLSSQRVLRYVASTLLAFRGGEGKSVDNRPRPWWSPWMRDVEGITSPGVGTSPARVPVLPATLEWKGFASYPSGMFEHSPESRVLLHAAILCLPPPVRGRFGSLTAVHYYHCAFAVRSGRYAGVPRVESLRPLPYPACTHASTYGAAPRRARYGRQIMQFGVHLRTAGHRSHSSMAVPSNSRTLRRHTLRSWVCRACMLPFSCYTSDPCSRGTHATPSCVCLLWLYALILLDEKRRPPPGSGWSS